MAGSKITELTEITAPSDSNDVLEIVVDTATTPVNRRIKVLNLLKRIFLGDGTQLTVTTIADGEFLKRSGSNITSGSVVTGPAAQIDETSGPATLDIGGITDGEFLKRVGSEIVSDTFSSGIGGSTGSTDNALLRADGTGGLTAQGSAVTIDDNGAITVPEIAAPATPAAGKVVIYAKSDNKVYRKGEDGVEAELGGAAGGTTINATDGRLPYRSNSSTFADSFLANDSSNGQTTSIAGHIMVSQNNGKIIGFGNTTIAFGGFQAAGQSTVRVVADDSGNPGALLSAFATPPAPGGNPSPWSSTGMNFRQVLGANTTIGNPGQHGGNGTALDGYRFLMMLAQNATGGWTVTWSSDFKFPGGTPPTMTATANAVDAYEFIVYNDIAYCIGKWQDLR